MRSLVGTVTLTSLVSSGPREGTWASNVATGASPGLAAVVVSVTLTPKSPMSAVEWLITENLIRNFPGPASAIRNPTSSTYLVNGCLLVGTATPGGSGGPAGLVCFASGAEEQPARASTRKITVIRTSSA